MAGWFELKQGDSGKFWFVLAAGNGETILRSEQYESKASAQNGIASVQQNCASDGRFDRKEASDGRFFFNLKAGNHQVIGTSQMYKSSASRDAGIESVKNNGSTETIKTPA